MREIKFRSKSLTGKWVYGNLSVYDFLFGENLTHMNGEDIMGERYDDWVDKDSVGQYTGVRDKNGKEIYEGDIIDIVDQNHKIKTIRAEVRWSETYLAYIIVCKNITNAFENLGDYLDYDITVIGNKFDNPELLEEDYL